MIAHTKRVREEHKSGVRGDGKHWTLSTYVNVGVRGPREDGSWNTNTEHGDVDLLTAYRCGDYWHYDHHGYTAEQWQALVAAIAEATKGGDAQGR